MVCAPVRSIIPSLKLDDYLSIQAHKSCSISHLDSNMKTRILSVLSLTPKRKYMNKNGLIVWHITRIWCASVTLQLLYWASSVDSLID